MEAAEQFWKKIRGNSGELPSLVILPTQLTPSKQKDWMDEDVVRQYASLKYAATECYSAKRKVEPSVESRMLYGGGSAFDIVAAYLRGRVNPTVVEKAVESHFLHLLSIGRTRSCLDALEAVVYDPAKQNEEEAVTFYIDLAVMSTDEQREIFLAWSASL